MIKHPLSVVTALVIASLSFAASADEAIYGQYPKRDDPLNNFNTYNISDSVPDQVYGQMVADNFTLVDSDATLTGINWWGGSDGQKNSGLDNFETFTIKILSNVDEQINSKANIIYEETFLLNDTYNISDDWVGHSSDGQVVYRQHVNFKEAIPLCRGTEYWISISAKNVASDQSDNSFRWYGADSAQLIDNTIWIADFFETPVVWSEFFEDQGFELKGTNTKLSKIQCPAPTPAPTPTAKPTPIPQVPIPPAVWLFGSGLAGLFAVARRRKPKS